MSSEIRIALIAEGLTDTIILEASLKAILHPNHPFVLTQLQPEATRPELGTGWGGVLKWCYEQSSRGLEADPTLSQFDLIIIHLDADVLGNSYADYGPDFVNLAADNNFHPLPCQVSCPPPSSAIDQLKIVLSSWLDPVQPATKTVVCIPSKSSDAWLVAGAFTSPHKILSNIQCNLNLETQLLQLPVKERFKKTGKDYRIRSEQIEKNWSVVKSICPQAQDFETEVKHKLSLP
jgi:hypothetical protein